MKKLISILIIFIFAFSVSAQDAVTIFQRGFESYKNGKFDDAIKDFTEVIRLQPNFPNSYGMRGICYFEKRSRENPPMRMIKVEGVPVVYKSQNSVNAIADLTKAIQLHPPLSATSQSAVFELYRFRFWSNKIDFDFRPAIADLKAMANANSSYQIKLSDGSSPNVKEVLVVIQNEHAEYLIFQTRGYNQAIAAAEKLLAVRYDEIENQNLQQSKTDLKSLYVEAAQNYQPNNAETFYKRGNAYSFAENWKAAIADYKESLRLKPNDLLAVNSLAYAYRNDKQYNLAIAEYDKVILSAQFEWQKRSATIDKARVLVEAGKIDEAIGTFNAEIAKQPEGFLYLERGRAYAKKGNKQLAKADFNKAKELSANTPFGYETIRDANKELEILDGKSKTEPERKPQSVQPKASPTPQTVKQNPTSQPVSQTALANADEYFARGRKFYDSGRADEAIADFTEAIKLNKNHYEAYFYRADTLWRKKGEFEKAVADYNETIRLNPNFTNAYYWRGVVYKELKKFDLAKADFQTTLKLMPTHSLAKQQLESLPK